MLIIVVHWLNQENLDHLQVEGANPADIKVMNICIDLDLSTAQGASVEIKNINNALEVTVIDNNEKFANPQCVYILVGPEQVMG